MDKTLDNYKFYNSFTQCFIHFNNFINFIFALQIILSTVYLSALKS